MERHLLGFIMIFTSTLLHAQSPGPIRTLQSAYEKSCKDFSALGINKEAASDKNQIRRKVNAYLMQRNQLRTCLFAADAFGKAGLQVNSSDKESNNLVTNSRNFFEALQKYETEQRYSGRGSNVIAPVQDFFRGLDTDGATWAAATAM